MRVLITGSRTWEEKVQIWTWLHALALRANMEEGRTLTVVHGACPKGVDAYVARWLWYATRDGSWDPVTIVEEAHPADWKIGRHAGMLRNQHMVNLGADLVLAFIRDNSPGATHCAARAEAAGIETRIFREQSQG